MSSYRIVLDKHIIPLIGAVKLSALTVPMARAFEDRLRADRSPAMVRKIMGMLGSVLADAQERGLVAQNVVRSLRGSRRRDKDRARRQAPEGEAQGRRRHPRARRDKGDHRALCRDAGGRCLLTAIFTGLRASELRGLRWADVDLKRGELHVRQRADRYNAIGRPKSAAGERTIPLAPMLVNTLREWKLACPKSELDLAFPTASGRRAVPVGHRPARILAGADRGGRHRRSGQAEIHRVTQPAALLRLVVHQSARRWRARTAAEARPKPPRALDSQHDGRCLRAPVPARRRRRGAGRRREGIPELSKFFLAGQRFVDELVRLRSLFVQSQMQVLAEQVQELGKTASKAATASMKGSRNEDTW